MEHGKLSKSELKGAIIVMGLMTLIIIAVIIIIYNWDTWEYTPHFTPAPQAVQEDPLEKTIKNLENRVDDLEKRIGDN